MRVGHEVLEDAAVAENDAAALVLLLELTDAYVLSVAALTIGRRRADAETAPDA